MASATDMESVSKGCAFGVAVSSYFALTGRSEGALLRSNAISRRRIMPQDDNALMVGISSATSKLLSSGPGENEVSLPVSELNRKYRILFAKLHSPLPIHLKHEK